MRNTLDILSACCRLQRCFQSLSALMIFLLFATSAYSQFEVSGRVTDDHWEPLAGVNIMLHNSIIGLSGPDGSFKLSIRGDTMVLQFYFIGYDKKYVKVFQSGPLDIQMDEVGTVTPWSKKKIPEKPIQEKKSESSICSVYTIDTILLENNLRHYKAVVMPVNEIMVYLPYDSLVQEVSDFDSKYATNFLRRRVNRDTIQLSKKFIQITSRQLNDLALRMILAKSISITLAKAKIGHIIVKRVENSSHGTGVVFGWYGFEFWAPGGKAPLFREVIWRTG